MKNNKGLTLIELIIVLAIIAVIGAILIPNFLSTTDKARLRSDIQSARVIDNAMELYNAEQSRSLSSLSFDAALKELIDKGYIKNAEAIIQTEGAKWEADSEKGVVVNIAGSSNEVKNKAYSQLSDQEKIYVKGI